MAERMVEFEDVRLCTEAFGNAKDPTILLIMGAQASMIWWEDDFCTQLSLRGFHVIRYDNRDVGKSTVYERGNPLYTFSDMADDAVRILDAYGVEKAHIAGMSMGGIIAQILALRHPQRVLTLTLMMTSNFDPSLPPREATVARAMAEIRLMDHKDENQVTAYVLKSSKAIAGSGHSFDELRIRQLAEKDYVRANNWICKENHALIKGWGPYLERTGEINCPTLVIHGTEDPIILYEHGIHLSKVIPGAWLVTLEGTGHEIHPEDWDDIIKAITENVHR